MASDSYFDEAFKQLLTVADSQQKHWDALPLQLEKMAANFAIKANSATVSAVAPLVEMLSKVEDELYKQGSLLAALKDETSQLARQSSFHSRDLKSLKRELAALKAKVLAAEDRINLLEKVR